MKKFIIKIGLYSLPIILSCVYCVWYKRQLIGDLSKLSFITFDNYNITVNPPTNNTITCNLYKSDWQSNDILIIGDSFTQNTRKNSYNFCQYLSNFTDCNIHVIEYDTLSSMRKFISMCQHAMPKIVIIESVERTFLNQLSAITFNEELAPIENSATKNITTIQNRYLKKFKNTFNHTQKLYKVKTPIIDCDYNVKCAHLNKPCFTCPQKENELFFYGDDLYDTPNQLGPYKSKLDDLFYYASNKGIKLYILIASDKYDIYQDYIVDNYYRYKTLNNLIRENYNNDYLILSADTLSSMVENDVMDIYWGDDTHWSPIGAKAVTIQLAKRINKNEGLELFHVE